MTTSGQGGTPAPAWPRVSVITVNYNGRHHLEGLFPSLLATDYPPERLEIILVDNASRDGSVRQTLAHHPGVKIVQTGANLGYGGGLNAGVAEACGEYVALLNNDMRVDPGWLKALVVPLLSEEETACTAARILSWDGRTVDFAGSAANCYGYGYQRGFGWPVGVVANDRPAPILFACGGAMLVRRAVYEEVGGFDADYGLYYEDVDFGWRLWALGYRVLYVPDATVYHHHHGSAGAVPRPQLELLYARNALRTIIKNYDDEHLARVLPAALLIQNGRALRQAGVDRRRYDLGRTLAAGRDPFPHEATARLLALGDLADEAAGLWAKRARIQATRRRPDREIVPLFKQPLGPSAPGAEDQMAQREIGAALGVETLFASHVRNRVLIVTHEPVTRRMAGPAIRAWELARVLSRECDVTLLAPNDDPIPGDGFLTATHAWDESLARTVANDHDVIVSQGFVINRLPALTELGKCLVVDLYDPVTLADLHTQAGLPTEQRLERHDRTLGALNAQLLAGDFFLAGSEQQRDWWLGLLGANGRLNPLNHERDSTFTALIDTVSFGIGAEPPHQTRPVLKGVHPGIATDDIVALWGGGLWDWFDPDSLLRAMALVRARRPRLKLFFMGVRSPNPDVPVTVTTERAIALAAELGLLDQTVFFNDWVDYEDRQNYLLEADLGVSLHHDHLETRFSLRTRLFDYIWAGLPILTTRGDAMSRLVVRHGLGVTVGDGDVDDVAGALLRLTEGGSPRERYGAGFAAVREELTWERVAAPLVRFCRAPRRAADQLHPYGARLRQFGPPRSDVLPGPVWSPPPWYTLPGRAAGYLRQGGVTGLREKVGQHLARRERFGPARRGGA